jgi:large subunit ribosomal protein L10
MNKALKKNIIDSFLQEYNRSVGLFVINFSRIKVSDITNFKKALAVKQGKMVIVKNSLLRRGAMENIGLAGIKNQFSHQIALVAAFEDPCVIAKEVNGFIKQFESISFKAGVLKQSVIDAAQFNSIAKIGTVKTLQAQLCGMLKNPVSKLVSVLSQIAKNNNSNNE